ncbi:hypothetical protein PFISCL1PPCAC_16260, partial [Pristionchus fissidentatus]
GNEVTRGREDVEKGAVFNARLAPNNSKNPGTRHPLDDIKHKVVELYERINGWEGVLIRVVGFDVKAELEGEIVERRSSCCVFDTIPFGRITYPLNKSYLPRDVRVGDRMRATVMRYRNEANDDHPSRWQVTGILGNKKTNEEWYEGIVTGLSNPNRYYISFEQGNAFYNKKEGIGPFERKKDCLTLGDVVDVCVRSTEDKTFFDVVQIGSETSRKKDITVEMMRKRDKKDLPSCWHVIGVTSYSPRYAASHHELIVTGNSKTLENGIDAWSATSSTHSYISQETKDDAWTTV